MIKGDQSIVMSRIVLQCSLGKRYMQLKLSIDHQKTFDFYSYVLSNFWPQTGKVDKFLKNLPKKVLKEYGLFVFWGFLICGFLIQDVMK